MTRRKAHDWRADCEKCSKCGKTQKGAHNWNQDCEKCARCGKTRDSAHDWSTECTRCSRCGKTRSEGHDWKPLGNLLDGEEDVGTKDRTHAWLDIRTVPNLICRRCGRYNLETISEQRRTKARDREAGIDLLFALSWARQNKAVALICSGADLNVGTTKYGDTALHIAANLGLLHAVEVLVEYCDVNRTNNVDVTPLHGAAFGGRDQVVKLLLSNGANRHALTRRGETAKELALMNRRTSTAGLL